MKAAKIFFWVSTVFIFLFEGVMPLSTLLFTPEYVNVGAKPLGYPDYFAVTLIIFKFLGALAILLPATPGKLREWAYAGLSFNLIFAIISHVVVDKNPMYIMMPVVILAILGVLYFTRNRIKSARSRQEFAGTSQNVGFANA